VGFGFLGIKPDHTLSIRVGNFSTGYPQSTVQSSSFGEGSTDTNFSTLAIGFEKLLSQKNWPLDKILVANYVVEESS
jgi:hypothetical protein